MKRIACWSASLAFMLGLVPASAATPGPSYALVKSAIASISRGHRLEIDRNGDGFVGCGTASSCYDIESCELGSDFIGAPNETATGIYADVANYVSIWENDLPKVGYPERAWRPWISSYEAAAIATVKRYGAAAFYQRSDSTLPPLSGLRRVLMKYRAAHPKALKIIIDGGCGAGEEPIKVVTLPVATQVSIIPAFFFELCRVQRIDPNDTTRCAHWREISGTVTQVSGDYHYIARWHDGTVKRGMLGVNAPPAMLSGTVTLRKP